MLVTEQNESGLANLLCALSFAHSLGAGRPLDAWWRTAYIAALIADTASFATDDRAAVYYGALVTTLGAGHAGEQGETNPRPKSSGRSRSRRPRQAPERRFFSFGTRNRLGLGTLWGPEQPVRPSDSMLDALASAPFNPIGGIRVAELSAKRLGLPEDVQEAVRYGGYRWEGEGTQDRRSRSALPIAARALHLAQAIEAAHRLGDRTAAVAVAREGSGTEFDPELVSAFVSMSRRPEFWRALEGEEAEEAVLRLRPDVPFDVVTEGRVDSLCYTLADLADIRSPVTWGHSARVATLATAITRRLRLLEEDAVRIRRAALVHDLGKVAVPPAILAKRERLSHTEWETFRLHPYYTERILVHVNELNSLARDAASHHERVDGGGYYRQLSGDQIPLGGRILAVADTYVLHTQDSTALDVEQALRHLRLLAGTRLDPACVEALADCLDGRTDPVVASRRPEGQGHLTARETEVLRHLALGMTNRDLAETLGISEKTIEHHLDHIYEKLGVSSRTSAVVHAVHKGLVEH